MKAACSSNFTRFLVKGIQGDISEYLFKGWVESGIKDGPEDGENTIFQDLAPRSDLKNKS